MKEKKRKNLKNIEILFWVGYVFLLLAEMFLRVEIIKNYVSILDTIGMCILLFFSFIRIVQRKEWKNLKNDIREMDFYRTNYCDYFCFNVCIT